MALSGKQKKDRYKRIVKQLAELMPKSNSPIARMATIAAVLHHKMPHFFWTGFYLVGEGKLVVGPYQGPVACQELTDGQGVCWACMNKGSSLLVDDVRQFPGHIACDRRSRSEIVIPVRDKTGLIVAVLDVDSDRTSDFDDDDRIGLEEIVPLIFS